jgi:hypothetical protein
MRQVQELEERPFKSGAAQTLTDRVFSNNKLLYRVHLELRRLSVPAVCTEADAVSVLSRSSSSCNSKACANRVRTSRSSWSSVSTSRSVCA